MFNAFTQAFAHRGELSENLRTDQCNLDHLLESSPKRHQGLHKPARTRKTSHFFSKITKMRKKQIQNKRFNFSSKVHS